MKNCPEEEKSQKKAPSRSDYPWEKATRELWAPLRDSGHPLNMTYLVRSMGMDTKKRTWSLPWRGMDNNRGHTAIDRHDGNRIIYNGRECLTRHSGKLSVWATLERLGNTTLKQKTLTAENKVSVVVIQPSRKMSLCHKRSSRNAGCYEDRRNQEWSIRARWTLITQVWQSKFGPYNDPYKESRAEKMNSTIPPLFLRPPVLNRLF